MYYRKILSLLIFLLSLHLQAQSFEALIQKGDDLYSEEKYSESGKEYENAFDLKEGNAGQYYNAACSWALAGDSLQSLKYLHLSADKGWKNLKHLKSDKDLASLHSLEEWDRLLEQVKANLQEYEKDFDMPLKKQLDHIYVRDQTLRQLYRTAQEKFGRKSEEMEYYLKLISEQDSINLAEVTDIIEERGWVGKNLIGENANITLWLVIQHAPLEIQEKYLPLLRESVLKGESQGGNLALLEDRIQMRNGQPQTYGSQIVTDKKTGEQTVYKIREPQYVDQRRKKVGLGPIADYVKRWGIEWNIEQKEK